MTRSRRSGLTLIEVVAGLTLMASILVAILFLKTRYAHQQALAERRLRSIAAADALMTDWWLQPRKIPRNASGMVAGSSTLAWRTRLLPRADIDRLGAVMVRLEVFDAGGDLAQVDRVAVDFLLPSEVE